MVISTRLKNDEVEKYMELLTKSQLGKAEYIRKCVLNCPIIVSKDIGRDQRIYQEIYKIKSEIERLQKAEPKIDFSQLETGVYNICNSMLNS